MKWLKFLKAAKKRTLEDGAEPDANDDAQQKHSKRRSMQQDRKERTSIEQWHEARKSRTSIDICAAFNVTTTERLSVCKAGITLLINRTYIVIKHLGSGSSGQVKLAFNLRSKKLVAIKAVRKGGSGGGHLLGCRDARSYDGRGSHGGQGGGSGGGGGYLGGSQSVNAMAAAGGSGGGAGGGGRGWRSITPSSMLRRSASSNVGTSTAASTCRGSSASPLRRSGAGACPTEEFVREIAILKRLSHPNIVQLVEVIDDPASDCLLLVMGYVEGSTLQPQQLQPGRWQPLPEQIAWRYTRDVLCGLEYLHCHGVVHGDLKPANFIQDSLTGVVRILDFGSAVLHGRVVGAEGLRGAHVPMGCTPGFRSPESLAAGYRPSFELDMWALGVCLYLWVFGELPFKGSAPFVVYENIRSAPLVVPTHTRISSQLTDLITRLLDKDPSTRMTVHGVVQHAWTTAQGLAPLRTTSPVVMAARLQLATSQYLNNNTAGVSAMASTTLIDAQHAPHTQDQQAQRLFQEQAAENFCPATGASFLPDAPGVQAAMTAHEQLQQQPPQPQPQELGPDMMELQDAAAAGSSPFALGAGVGAGGPPLGWQPQGSTAAISRLQSGGLRSHCSSSINLLLATADGASELADPATRRGCGSFSVLRENGAVVSEPWLAATVSVSVPSSAMLSEPQLLQPLLLQPQLLQPPSVASAAAWQDSCWQASAPAAPASARRSVATPEPEGPWRMTAFARPTGSSTGIAPHVPLQPPGTMPRITEGSIGNTGSLGGLMSAAMAAAVVVAGSNGGGGGGGRRNSCEAWELRRSVTDDELQAAISSCCNPAGSAAVLMESIFTEVTFPAKHQIIHAGDPLDRIYLITAGEVEIYHDLAHDGPDAPCPHKPIIEGLSDPESELDDPGDFLNIRLPGSNVPQLERLSTGLLNITGGTGGSNHGAAHALSALAAAAAAGGSQSSGANVSTTGYIASASVFGMAMQAGAQYPNSARTTLTGLSGSAAAAAAAAAAAGGGGGAAAAAATAAGGGAAGAGAGTSTGAGSPAVGGAAGKGSNGREPSSSSIGLFSRGATQTGHLIVAAKGPGDSLGFAGMLPGAGQPVWSANVRARTQVTAFTATVESLHKLAKAHPQVEPLVQQMAVQQETDIAVAEAMRSLRLVGGGAPRGTGCISEHHHHHHHNAHHHHHQNSSHNHHQQQQTSNGGGAAAGGGSAAGAAAAGSAPLRPTAAGAAEAATAARGAANTGTSSEGESESCGTMATAATALTAGSGSSPAGSTPAQRASAASAWHSSASTADVATAATGGGCVIWGPGDGGGVEGDAEMQGEVATDVMVG